MKFAYNIANCYSVDTLPNGDSMVVVINGKIGYVTETGFAIVIDNLPRKMKLTDRNSRMIISTEKEYINTFFVYHDNKIIPFLNPNDLNDTSFRSHLPFNDKSVLNGQPVVFDHIPNTHQSGYCFYTEKGELYVCPLNCLSSLRKKLRNDILAVSDEHYDEFYDTLQKLLLLDVDTISSVRTILTRIINVQRKNNSSSEAIIGILEDLKNTGSDPKLLSEIRYESMSEVSSEVISEGDSESLSEVSLESISEVDSKTNYLNSEQLYKKTICNNNHDLEYDELRIGYSVDVDKRNSLQTLLTDTSIKVTKSLSTTSKKRVKYIGYIGKHRVTTTDVPYIDSVKMLSDILIDNLIFDSIDEDAFSEHF